jgi:hypothetical protein
VRINASSSPLLPAAANAISDSDCAINDHFRGCCICNTRSRRLSSSAFVHALARAFFDLALVMSVPPDVVIVMLIEDESTFDGGDDGDSNDDARLFDDCCCG